MFKSQSTPGASPPPSARSLSRPGHPAKKTGLASVTALFLSALLAACATPTSVAPPCAACECPQCPAPAVVPAIPVTPPPPVKPMQPARWSDLPGWSEDDVVAALPAFMQSCRGLASKPQYPLWRTACEEGRTLAGRDVATVRAFFEARFEPWLMTMPDGSTSGLVTGYYEPLLRGSRSYGRPYQQPVHGVPPDLLTIELGDLLPDLKNMRLRGRLQDRKSVV